MLLGGLALRNIGTVLTDERVFSHASPPMGAIPLEGNSSMPNSSAAFYIDDPLTQLAGLLVVNPHLSSVLRQLALTTILTRAGLGIDPGALKSLCGSVFRLALLPCLVEALALTIVTRFLIGWPWAWGAVLG